MQSSTQNALDRAANLGFLVLFPGFAIYHFGAAVGMPLVLGGLFGPACAAFAMVAVVQLALQFQSERDELPLLLRAFVHFCAFFFVWVLVAGAANSHKFTAMAAVVESMGTLMIWLAVFFVSSRMTLETRAMRLAVFLSALVLVGIFIYAIASEGSILGPFLLFTGKDELGDRDGVATYQGIGRSILIVAIVVSAWKRRFSKQALILAIAVACLLCLGSRAHLVGAVLCGVALAAVVGFRKGQRVAMLCFVAGVIAVSYVALEFILETRASEFLDLGTSASWQARVELQHRAMQVIAEYPMTGEFGYHFWGTFNGYAHNAMAAWAGFGVVIFLAYIGMMGYASYLSVRRVLLPGVPEPLWLMAFLANIVAVLLAVFSEPIQASVFPALGWGLTVNALRQERRRRKAVRAAVGVAVSLVESPANS
jgi:hypothetical protein